MLNYIWAAMILISVLFGAVQGRMSEVSDGMLDGAQSALELFFVLLTMMILWGGLMSIAEKSGVTKAIGKVLSPIIYLLFPEQRNDKKTGDAISMNIAANMLGLGNAATPLGIKAMQQLQLHNNTPDTATKSMIMFVVINTVSVQIIPTGTIAIRATAGSQNPASILPAVLLASFTSAVIGVVIALLLGHLFERKEYFNK